MSGQSPSTVLYTSAGTELDVQNNTAVPAGTGAILISGVSPSGNSNWIPASQEGNLGVTEMANYQTAQSAATVTATGSFTTTSMFAGAQEIALVVDVGTVTGAGSIQYTIQEIDVVGNLYGNSATTSVITTGNAPGVFTAILPVTTAMNFKITWTVTGTFSATITSYVVSKSTPSTQTVNGTITTTNNSVGTDGAAALGFDTQVGGKTTTAAPTYTTGNLDALSLTTLGGLRIDGVYAAGTANATAADVMNSGGYVTTAAPTYTTGQLEPLSLDTAGNLRTSVNNTVTVTGTTVNNQSVGADGAAFLGFDTQIGGRVVAGPPTYTAGNLNALTLDVGGNLRVVTNKASTAATTSVAVTANAATTLLAANTSRVFAAVYNNTNKNMYIALGSTASTTNFTILLITGSYWEVPVDWTGSVSEFSPNAASGSALVTELTP